MIEEKSNIDIELEIVKNPHCKEGLLFYKHFKLAPKFCYNIYDIHPTIKKDLYEKLDKCYNFDLLDKEHFFMDNGNNDMSFESFMIPRSDDNLVKIDITKKIIISIESTQLTFYSLTEIDTDIKNDLEDIVQDGIDTKKKNSVHILTYSADDGMYLTDFKIDDKYNDLDLISNYNEGFEDIHNDIINKLDSNDIGLYMLHGVPGTGKTTYIRHLIRRIPKRVIFVSPSMSDRFSNPEMIPFLMKYPDSIIVIEDAENVIESRKGGGNQSVSNLLNLSDGILGDCLKFQIICTFNTSKQSIDEALLRKGRLLKSYEFGELELDKTNSLLKSLGHKESKVGLCLSDIYNQESNNFEIKKSIGFS